MKVISREKWWVWLILAIFTYGTSNMILGALLDVYDENAWYTKPAYWIIAFACFIFPVSIMTLVFLFQITTQVCAKLNVPFKEIYLCPYIWLICIGVPIIGWALFLVMSIYVTFWPIVMLKRGEGEKYIN